MSDIQVKIDELAAALHKQLASNQPIDPNRLQQLMDMRKDRDRALVVWRRKRFNELQHHTRAMTARLNFSPDAMKLHAPTIDRILTESDLFDTAAVRWFQSEMCPWEDSEAASIAAGILVLANEIC